METAKELFEKLGYKCEKIFDDNTNISYESKLTETRIIFHTSEEKGNRLQVYAIGHSFKDSGMLTFAEIKAINKQIEELGWEDDTNSQMNWFKNVKNN